MGHGAGHGGARGSWTCQLRSHSSVEKENVAVFFENRETINMERPMVAQTRERAVRYQRIFKIYGKWKKYLGGKKKEEKGAGFCFASGSYL